ncbi:hypothetical protein ATANTOWER_030945, partial [Ataeniobius toweri]|nr:hypothetical protein [Ataeniobius toweri]
QVGPGPQALITKALTNSQQDDRKSDVNISAVFTLLTLPSNSDVLSYLWSQITNPEQGGVEQWKTGNIEKVGLRPSSGHFWMSPVPAEFTSTKDVRITDSPDGPSTFKKTKQRCKTDTRRYMSNPKSHKLKHK